MPTTRALPLLAAAVTAILLAACGGPAPRSAAQRATTSSTTAPSPTSTAAGTPPTPSGTAPGPATAPAAQVVNGACETTSPVSVLPQMQSGKPVVVAGGPTAVTVVWVPGTMTTPCAAQIEHLGSATAVELAKAVDAAPAISGSQHCPMATGATAELYFGYATPNQAAVVDVGLDGCQVVNGPGAAGRQLTTGLAHDLAQVAPAPWKGLLTTSG